MSMGEPRIETAMMRIEAAMARIEAARAAAADKSDTRSSASDYNDNAGSAKVMALVNVHEKLREEVADTIRELDSVIEELEG